VHPDWLNVNARLPDAETVEPKVPVIVKETPAPPETISVNMVPDAEKAPVLVVVRSALQKLPTICAPTVTDVTRSPTTVNESGFP